ncbi:hypothetical protein YSY43_12960 [Paenibacillus sp. YSY-4.3]
MGLRAPLVLKVSREQQVPPDRLELRVRQDRREDRPELQGQQGRLALRVPLGPQELRELQEPLVEQALRGQLESLHHLIVHDLAALP